MLKSLVNFSITYTRKHSTVCISSATPCTWRYVQYSTCSWWHAFVEYGRITNRYWCPSNTIICCRSPSIGSRRIERCILTNKQINKWFKNYKRVINTCFCLLCINFLLQLNLQICTIYFVVNVWIQKSDTVENYARIQKITSFEIQRAKNDE